MAGDETIQNSHDSFAQGKTDMDVAASDILEQIMGVKNQANDLVRNAWHGRASSTFEQLMRDYDRYSLQLNEALTDLAGLVQKVGGLHEDNEQSINSTMGAIQITI